MSRATNTAPLPRWVYITLGLACIPMGFWASYITLQYFEHGAAALEADPSLRALALSAALMFVASEMAAFALAALLTERQLWARRWMLTGFAVCVLLLEICTIVAVQLALTVGGEMSQSTVQDREKDLRARIGAIESGAAAKRADAAQLRAAGQLSKASRSSDGATAEQAQTAALYGELVKVQSQKRPTLVGLLGKDYALAYAVARGVLVSLGGLVFFGTAGALLRAARGVSVLTQKGELSTAPSFKQAGAIVPKNASTGFSYGSKTALAGAGALAAMGAAPMAHAAPAVPTKTAGPASATGVPNSIHPAGAATGTGVLKPVHQGAESGVSKPVQPAVKKPRAKSREVKHGTKIDTGVEGNAATRYNRVKAAVKSGSLKPSVRAVQKVEGGSQDVVSAYLKQLEADGVITRKGRGYAVAKKGGAA